MAGTTIYEFGALVPETEQVNATPVAWASDSARTVPTDVFNWLKAQALRLSDMGETAWLKMTQRRGQLAVQVNSYVGVIRAPSGYQIEVLPKVAKAKSNDVGDDEARHLLIEMLCCLGEFRHIQTQSAFLAVKRMPMLEVFIGEFLRAVEHVVKRGLRSDYNSQQDNLFSLRGKLQIAAHLRHNLCRRDRFFTAFDEFSPNRPENRLLHAALHRALSWTALHTHQQLARELCFVFADVPVSTQTSVDFQRVRPDRGMAHYDGALAWARLILQDESPLTGTGGHHAPSLLFPMEVVFEAFVAKHLARQLEAGFTLHTQVRGLSLVRHCEQDWFRLKPDLMIKNGGNNWALLDTKWKLISAQKATGSEKYGLSQLDFYQLYAYGQNYLNGQGELVLIYPSTVDFNMPLPVFDFLSTKNLRLWVLPFCLNCKRLIPPLNESVNALFAWVETGTPCNACAQPKVVG